jgi:hypothetical protein
MFEDFFGRTNAMESYIRNLVDRMVTNRLKNLKIQIPQNEMDESIREFFRTNKQIPLKDKTVDIYDLIREYTLDAIGLNKNGEVSEQFRKILQEEVANIIAKEGLKNSCNYTSLKTDTIEPIEQFEDLDDELGYAYDEGYQVGKNDTLNRINAVFAKECPGFNIVYNEEEDQYSVSTVDMRKQKQEEPKQTTVNFKEVEDVKTPQEQKEELTVEDLEKLLETAGTFVEQFLKKPDVSPEVKSMLQKLTSK